MEERRIYQRVGRHNGAVNEGFARALLQKQIFLCINDVTVRIISIVISMKNEQHSFRGPVLTALNILGPSTG
jgi:hypothetical protein